MVFTETKLYAGATWSFTETFDDFPASEYSCSIHLKHGADNAVTLDSTASGDDFVFSVAKETTKQFTKGVYTYQVVFYKLGEVEIYEEGKKEIFKLLSITADLRSSNKKILDAITAVLESRATREQATIKYADREIQYLGYEELIKAQKHFKALVDREDRVAAGKSGVPRLKERY